MPELEELEQQIRDVRLMAEDALDKFPLRSTTTPGAVRERHIHDLGKHPGGVIAARVHNSGALTISTSTFTALTFDTERFDTDTIHSTSSNTSRLTAKTAGKYIISGTANFASNATGRRIFDVQVNGTTVIARETWINPGANAANMTISTIFELAVDDYVELRAWQNSGGNLSIEANSNWSPEFMMSRVGAAGTAGGGTPGTDHGALTGLSDDDHSLYLLAAGSRALTADWDAGAFKITANGFRVNDNEDITLGTGSDTALDETGSAFRIVRGSQSLVIQSTDPHFKFNGGMLEVESVAAAVLRLKNADGTAEFQIAQTNDLTLKSPATLNVESTSTFQGLLTASASIKLTGSIQDSNGTGRFVVNTTAPFQRMDGIVLINGTVADKIPLTLRAAASQTADVFVMEDSNGVDFLNIDVSGNTAIAGKVGFNGQAVATAQNYTVTNGSTDRTFNANAVSIHELADIVSTLLTDLTTVGLVT